MLYREWLITVFMAAVHGVFHFYLRLLPAMIPVLLAVFGFPLWQLGLLVSVYSMSAALAFGPVGVMADRYDRRLVLAGGLSVVGAGYALMTVSDVLTGVPALRLLGHRFEGPFVLMASGMLLSGLGHSVHIPTGYPIISENVSRDTRGRAFAFWGVGANLGDAIAPAAVGVLIFVLTWEVILFGLGAAGMVLGVVLFVALGAKGIETVPAKSQSDDESDGEGPVDREGRVWSQRRRYLYPFLMLLVFMALLRVGTTGVGAFVPVYVANVYGYTLDAIGITKPESFADFALSVVLFSAAAARLVVGEVVNRYDARLVIVATLALAGLAVAALTSAVLSPALLLLVLVLVGAGLWGNGPARDVLISTVSPDERLGRTWGYLSTSAAVFGAGAPVAMGYIADVSGLRASFAIVVVAIFAAAASIALLLSDAVYDDRVDEDA